MEVATATTYLCVTTAEPGVGKGGRVECFGDNRYNIISGAAALMPAESKKGMMKGNMSYTALKQGTRQIANAAAESAEASLVRQATRAALGQKKAAGRGAKSAEASLERQATRAALGKNKKGAA